MNIKYAKIGLKSHLINKRHVLDVVIVSITAKPYILQKSLLQWICSKILCVVTWARLFWPPRLWRLLEAKKPPQKATKAWRSRFFEKSRIRFEQWQQMSKICDRLPQPTLRHSKSMFGLSHGHISNSRTRPKVLISSSILLSCVSLMLTEGFLC